MTEKYWITDEFVSEMDGLQIPDAYVTRGDEVFKDQPSVWREAVPEWWWMDATDEELHLNVHQAYSDIAASAMIGNPLSRIGSEVADETRFTAVTHDESQWATYSVNTGDAFQRINDHNFHDVDHEVAIIEAELQSMISMVQFLRFETREPTTQLIAPFFGDITLNGSLSVAARDYIKLQALESDHEIDYPPGTELMRSIGRCGFGDEPIACGVGVGPDGRFISNTGAVMGTGSLMVLPEAIYDNEKIGYQYTSHNLDSAFSRLWAFCGLAKIVGDAHRYYANQAQLN